MAQTKKSDRDRIHPEEIAPLFVSFVLLLLSATSGVYRQAYLSCQEQRLDTAVTRVARVPLTGTRRECDPEERFGCLPQSTENERHFPVSIGLVSDSDPHINTFFQRMFPLRI